LPRLNYLMRPLLFYFIYFFLALGNARRISRVFSGSADLFDTCRRRRVSRGESKGFWRISTAITHLRCWAIAIAAVSMHTQSGPLTYSAGYCDTLSIRQGKEEGITWRVPTTAAAIFNIILLLQQCFLLDCTTVLLDCNSKKWETRPADGKNADFYRSIYILWHGRGEKQKN
jgi:hypothetical protein